MTIPTEDPERADERVGRPLRIVLADDHDALRRGLRYLIEMQSNIEVVSEVTTGPEAVAETRRLKPDVTVLDISMPKLNGLEAARQIRSEVPDTEVLILTAHAHEALVEEALRAGARGYLFKSDAAAELVPAIQALSRRDFFVSPRVASRLSRDLSGGKGRSGSPADPA